MFNQSWKSFLIHCIITFFAILSLVVPMVFAMMFLQYAEKIKPEFFDIFLPIELCYFLIVIPEIFIVLLYVSGLDFVWLCYGEKKK